MPFRRRRAGTLRSRSAPCPRFSTWRSPKGRLGLPFPIARRGSIMRRSAGSSTELSAGLAEAGIGKGDTVALYLPNTPYHPIAFFAVLRLGARIAHLSPLDAPRELAYKLKDSGARDADHHEFSEPLAERACRFTRKASSSVFGWAMTRIGGHRPVSRCPGGRASRRSWTCCAGLLRASLRRSRPMTWRSCNIRAAPRECPRAPC